MNNTNYKTPPRLRSPKGQNVAEQVVMSPYVNPVVKVSEPVTLEVNSFRYTFSPGRGPFSGRLESINKIHPNSETDKTRVTIAPDNFLTPIHQALRENLTPYLNTQEGGLLSDVFGTTERFNILGEPFEGHSNSKTTGDLGRIHAQVSERDATSLRLTTQLTILDFWWSSTQIFALANQHSAYELFLFPQRQDLDIDKGKADVNRFLTTPFSIEFTHSVSEQQTDPAIYDWRRRMDSFVAEVSNLDQDIAALDLVSLDERYSKKTREDLKQVLISDLNDCRKHFSGMRHAFESSTITLSMRMAQYANKTLQIIQADLSLRRARLEFIKSCLENSDVTMPGATPRNLFDIEENKKGLCETLFNDLERPLIESKEDETLFQQSQNALLALKAMRDGIKLFDIVFLKGIVSNLMQQVNIKRSAFNKFCQQSHDNLQQEVWSAAKSLLNETTLVPQLRALSEHMGHAALKDLAEECNKHFLTSSYTRKELKQALQKKGGGFGPIVDSIRLLLLDMSSLYSRKHAHRRDFVMPITQEELDKNEGFDPFLMYCVKKILVPRQELIKQLKQISDLNAYYTLLRICESWNTDLKRELEATIEKLKLVNFEDDNFEERIKVLIFGLSDVHKKILHRELIRVRSRYVFPIVEEYIQRLYENFAAQSALSSFVGDSGGYIDEHYRRALSLPHGFTAFDTVTGAFFIEKKLSSRLFQGVNSDDYKTAIFFRQFYTGIFFRDYLRDNPQLEEGFRAFLYTPFSAKTNEWISAHFSVLSHEKTQLVVSVVDKIRRALAAVIERDNASQSYIDTLEKNLQQYQKIQMLGFARVKMLPDTDPEPEESGVTEHEIVLQKKGNTLRAYWKSTNQKMLRSQELDNAIEDEIELPAPDSKYSYDLNLRKYLGSRCVLSEPTGTPVNTIILKRDKDSLTAYWTEKNVFKTKRLAHAAAQPVVNSLEENATTFGCDTILPLCINMVTSSFGCEPLCNEHLSLLEDSWAYFISICTWIAALVNRYLFSSDQIAYIHLKIEKILRDGEHYFTPTLLATMRNMWTQYCELNDISRKAIEEWRNEKEVSTVSIKSLYQCGEKLFFSDSTKDKKNVFEKTLWLSMALQFYHGIEDILKSKKRISFKESAENSSNIAQNRRMYIVKILGYILSSLTLSSSQKDAMLQCTQDIFENQEIKTLTLDNSVDRIKELEKDNEFSQINDFIESQIPGFVFSDEDCYIFEDQNFAYDVTQRLGMRSEEKKHLSIKDFFRQLLAGLNCVAVLAKDEKYHIFLPCLMGRLLTAFGVAYKYLMVSSMEVKGSIMDLWKDCHIKIKEMSSSKITSQCHSFVEAWKKIKDSFFDSNINNILLAYKSYLELEESGFSVRSGIDIIFSEWLRVTIYKIAKGEVKALSFILKPQPDVGYKKFDEKLRSFSEFLIHGVKEIRQLGDVLCIHVLDSYRLSSLFTSGIENVRVGKNGKLENGGRHSREIKSLDQITIDLAKIYSASAESDSKDCPVIFIYQNKKTTRCVEVYKQGNEVVRNDCLASESSWLSLAARSLPISEQDTSSQTLAGMIFNNSLVGDSVLITARILPEFFDLVLQLVRDSRRFMEQQHAHLTPISSVFLQPASAVYYNPQSLSHCDENELTGIFILGLIYDVIQKKENKISGVSTWWLHNLPKFFADLTNGKDNVKNLAAKGIVDSGLLEKRYGSSGDQDPIAIAIRGLDEKLKSMPSKQQKDYCTFYKSFTATSDETVTINCSNGG